MGRWVAISQLTSEVAGVGDSAESAEQMARHNRLKERFYLHFVDPRLIFSSFLLQVAPVLAATGLPIHLVGGAVRDALLGKICHDLDFVVPENAIQLTFRVADALGAAAYVLDRERDTGRVVLTGETTTLDFAALRGPDLVADLGDRDFTINAMALPMSSLSLDALVDPFGGGADLTTGVVRAVRADSIERDPARVLRAVRQALQFDFTLAPETAAAVKASAEKLPSISAERIRDELLKTLSGPHPAQAVHLWRDLGILPIVLPEIAALEGVEQSPPHHEPVLAHTASVLDWLQQVEAVVLGDVDDALNAVIAPWRAQIQAHLDRPIDGGLDGWHVLRLSTLFHDVGKAETQTVDEDGRIRFFGHDKVGAISAEKRLRDLKLSNEAIQAVSRIVDLHMRPLMLAQQNDMTQRALFRFCRAAGDSVADVVLLSLADHLATYDGPFADYDQLLALIGRILAFNFTRVNSLEKAPPLLNGGQVMALLGLKPGPEIGRMLRLLEEAQAVGEVVSAEDAITFVQQISQ
jgi:putative nucleotidyltransferase with HDIG domain